MLRLHSIVKMVVIFCCCLIVISCSHRQTKARLCGEATRDFFVPLNDWVPTDFRIEHRELKATIRHRSELQHGAYGSDCSQGAYKAYYSNDKRYLFRRGYYVSLDGDNLCVAKPEIYLWATNKSKRKALHNLFLKEKDSLEEALKILTDTIQAQCRQLPETVQLRYIMRTAYIDKSRIIREQDMHPRDFDYYQSRKAGALVEYTDIYRATFYPRRFLSGIQLLTANGSTTNNTSLKDEIPEIRQAYIAANKKHEDRVALGKYIQRAKREKEINEMYGPIAAIGMAMLQSFSLELADEGVCYFLTHNQNRFSKKDYVSCQNYLHDFQKQLSKDHKAFYALGNLIASMSNKQPRLVPEGGEINEAMNECAKALVVEFGSQRHGEAPTEKSLRNACADAAIQ